MTCPTCSGTVQCVLCRMEGRRAPRPRSYPGRRPLGGTLTHTIRAEPPPEPDPDEDHRALLVDTDRGRSEI
jgi:hypothetical protein